MCIFIYQYNIVSYRNMLNIWLYLWILMSVFILFIYIYIYSLYNLSHPSRISRTSPRYPKVSLKFRSRRGHCLLEKRLCDLWKRNLPNFSAWQSWRVLEKNLGIWKIPKSFRNASEYIKHVGKKRRRFAALPTDSICQPQGTLAKSVKTSCR